MLKKIMPKHGNAVEKRNNAENVFCLFNGGFNSYTYMYTVYKERTYNSIDFTFQSYMLCYCSPCVKFSHFLLNAQPQSWLQFNSLQFCQKIRNFVRVLVYRCI
jgi:hypothetical protein